MKPDEVKKNGNSKNESKSESETKNERRWAVRGSTGEKYMKNKLQRSEVLRILGLHKELFKTRYGVINLGIFGSVARGEAVDTSDVDVVVEMQAPDLFFMVHIKEELEEALDCPVDIVHYRNHMNEFLKKRINRDAVYV